MMWEACAEKTRLGGKIVMGAKVTGCGYDAAADLEPRVQGSKRKRADDRSRACDLVGADARVGPRLDAAVSERARRRPTV